jgi:branched-chain amino acid transport system permease protein
MAELVGIQVPSMIALAFVIGSIIAGITGIVVAPVITPHPIMGMHYLLLGFISAVVGGLGNAYGSMIGGLILGLLGIVISSYVFPVYADIATFVLLLIVLVARPKGLFAR